MITEVYLYWMSRLNLQNVKSDGEMGTQIDVLDIADDDEMSGVVDTVSGAATTRAYVVVIEVEAWTEVVVVVVVVVQIVREHAGHVVEVLRVQAKMLKQTPIVIVKQQRLKTRKMKTTTMKTTTMKTEMKILIRWREFYVVHQTYGLE